MGFEPAGVSSAPLGLGAHLHPPIPRLAPWANFLRPFGTVHASSISADSVTDPACPTRTACLVRQASLALGRSRRG